MAVWGYVRDRWVPEAVSVSGLPLVASAGLAGLGIGGERSQVRSWVVWPPHVCTKEPARAEWL